MVLLYLLHTVGEDYHTAEGRLVFNANADNPLKDFYTVLGDTVIEPDETILFRLSSPTGGVTLIGDRTDAVVTIVNDDCKNIITQGCMWYYVPQFTSSPSPSPIAIPNESGAIVLTGDTPQVTAEAGGISVRVQFTRIPEVASVTCALQQLRPAENCE